MAPKAKAKGKAKAGGAAKAKAKGKAQQSVAAALENRAATKIQAAVRRFLAVRGYPKLREKILKQKADLADALRAAHQASVRSEQRKREKELAKAEARAKKAKKLAADTKKALEAAFDGEVSVVRTLLDGGLPAEVCDGKKNSLLSEAAVGGCVELVSLLLELKANPNSRGEFDRTPLWRATNGGFPDCVPLLLEAGGDPRLYDSSGCAPSDVARSEELEAVLRDWDVTKTDELVEEWESWFEANKQQEDLRIQEAMKGVSSEYDEARAFYDATQKLLCIAKAEFRNREKEHGAQLAAGHEHAMESCKSAFEQLERAEAEADRARARLDAATAKRLEVAEALGAVAALPGREVQVKDLNSILVRDVGSRIAEAKQWPCVVDPSECAKKLIGYSGSALLSFWRQDDMQPERIRVALLSMIRAGGTLAIDLADFSGGVDRRLLSEPFDQVQAGLFQEIVSRDIMKPRGSSRWPRFTELAKKEEKGRFSVEMFGEGEAKKFKFLVLMAAEPHSELLESFEALRVIAPG